MGMAQIGVLLDIQRETLVIATIDFALDYPSPLMPHIIPISGLFRQKPQSLPNKLETFVQSSGRHGVIIVSFGTMFEFKNVEVFVDVFSKLDQKVRIHA